MQQLIQWSLLSTMFLFPSFLCLHPITWYSICLYNIQFYIQIRYKSFLSELCNITYCKPYSHTDTIAFFATYCMMILWWWWDEETFETFNERHFERPLNEQYKRQTMIQNILISISNISRLIRVVLKALLSTILF